MRVGIVGAGVAGLTTAKVLGEAGHQVVVYDKAPDVGGVWSRTRRYPGLTTGSGQLPRQPRTERDEPAPTRVSSRAAAKLADHGRDLASSAVLAFCPADPGRTCPVPGDSVTSVTVRPVAFGESGRFNDLLDAHHWLGHRLTGQVLRYVAELDGCWVAVLGVGSAALSCAARDAVLGWSREQQYARLVHIANNQRFCVLPEGRAPNLASAVLARALRRLPGDYLAVYGHRRSRGLVRARGLRPQPGQDQRPGQLTPARADAEHATDLARTQPSDFFRSK